MPGEPRALAQAIDYALLRPDAMLTDLEQACSDARRYGFAALMVNSCHVKRAAELLSGSEVKVGSVVGFPLGASTTTVKIVEAMESMKNGAQELDIVMNIGMLKSGRYDLVEIDIKNIIAMTPGVLHKVIVETGYLTRQELERASRIALLSGAEFIKTCTGFGPRGATTEDIITIRGTVGSSCLIKASGGIRDLDTAIKMLEAGADRVGTSSGPGIMEEFLSRLGS